MYYLQSRYYDSHAGMNQLVNTHTTPMALGALSQAQ